MQSFICQWENYFSVVFGELPFGCEECEWHYIYTMDGNVLTNDKMAGKNSHTVDGGDVNVLAQVNVDYTNVAKSLV